MLRNIQSQGQILFWAGALLSPKNEYHKFILIFFVGDSSIELDDRCETFTAYLRSDKYIHLHDANTTEVDAAYIGCLSILPADYLGSPLHMHEYVQDDMTYICA